MATTIPVKLTPTICVALGITIFVIGYFLGRGSVKEGFEAGIAGIPLCSSCTKPAETCKCTPKGMARLICPPCREPDMSKYVLKSSIPPCPACPDMSNYMLKTECPPVADLSKYVLRSSIPKQQPVIIDNSACKKEGGICPPCPRPRCPEVKCPPQTICPQPAPCPRPVCPPTKVKCRAEEESMSTVRPYLAPLSMNPFGN